MEPAVGETIERVGEVAKTGVVNEKRKTREKIDLRIRVLWRRNWGLSNWNRTFILVLSE